MTKSTQLLVQNSQHGQGSGALSCKGEAWSLWHTMLPFL